jgi:hypothetical protein
MLDDCSEVFAAFRVRGRAPGYFELVYLKRFQVFPVSMLTFRHINGLGSIRSRFIPEETAKVRCWTLTVKYFEGRGRGRAPGYFESPGMFTTFSIGSISGFCN